MFGIGAGELIVILIAGLVIFGPGKLPEVGRALGKGLREFRKAQAALSATLDEVSAEPKKKDEGTGKSEEKVSAEEKVSLEKNSTENPAVSVDDVINMAKQNPFVKENVDEKVFNGNDTVPADTSVGERVEPARSGGNSAEK